MLGYYCQTKVYWYNLEFFVLDGKVWLKELLMVMSLMIKNILEVLFLFCKTLKLLLKTTLKQAGKLEE